MRSDDINFFKRKFQRNMAKEHIQKGDGGLSAFVIQQTKNGGEASNVELFFSRIQNGTSINLNG